MSEIRVTTLKDTSGGNSSTTADIFSGRAKAWVNFNGQGAVAIRANFNVNSITDNGTGSYTVNFTNALSDGNYAFLAAPGDSTQTDGGASPAINNRTTTTAVVRTSNSGGSLSDDGVVSVAVFR